MSEIDSDDTGFSKGLKRLLKYNEEQIETLISHLDIDELNELADAVFHGNRQKARDVILAASVDEDEEDKRAMLEPMQQSRKKSIDPEQHSRDTNVDGSDHGGDEDDEVVEDDNAERDTASRGHLNFGDKVDYDGKQATVRVPKGPRNTVGIMIRGKLKMVDRKEIKRVDEMGISGMTMIPNIDRIKQLAGIAADEEEPEETEVEVEEIPATRPENGRQDQDGDDKEKDPVQCAMDALNTLEQCLPDIKLGDLKQVRARIYGLSNKMNEAAGFVRRPAIASRTRKS